MNRCKNCDRRLSITAKQMKWDMCGVCTRRKKSQIPGSEIAFSKTSCFFSADHGRKVGGIRVDFEFFEGKICDSSQIFRSLRFF